jgi:hypothetical protein
MGSALSFLAAFMPFAECIGENYYLLFLRSGITDEQFMFLSQSTISIAAFSLGLMSGTGGAIAFALSSSASCRTFPELFLKLLGVAYLVLAVTSILMLVALASFSTAQCNILLLWGGAFAIVAFFLYLGAGIFTLGMIKKKDVNRASVCTCCPYGNLTALPSVFGFIGSSLIIASSSIHESDPKPTFPLTMGLIASFVGVMVSVLGIVPGCQKVPSRDFKILGFTYILLGLMCLLTLVAYDIFLAAIFSIPAFVAFTVAGFSAFYLVKVSSQAHTSASAV